MYQTCCVKIDIFLWLSTDLQVQIEIDTSKPPNCRISTPDFRIVNPLVSRPLVSQDEDLHKEANDRIENLERHHSNISKDDWALAATQILGDRMEPSQFLQCCRLSQHWFKWKSTANPYISGSKHIKHNVACRFSHESIQWQFRHPQETAKRLNALDLRIAGLQGTGKSMLGFAGRKSVAKQVWFNRFTPLCSLFGVVSKSGGYPKNLNFLMNSHEKIM